VVKVAIITLHYGANYGSVLQAFATQEKFKQYAGEIEIIDYRRKGTVGFDFLKVESKNNILKMIALIPTFLKYPHIFKKFRNEYLQLSNQTYSDDESFKKMQMDADIYCTGSDQVWNTGWNGGIVDPLYLSFVPDEKRKFAYAASFGKDRYSDLEVEQSKKNIMRYEKISVREDSGVQILNEQYGYKKAIRIVDPTLAMPPEFWRAYTSEKKKIEGEYILLYDFKRSKGFDAYAKELSRKTGLRLIRLCTRYDQILRCGKSIVLPEVFDFITLIDNARYVLTDSFHGTAFAMNLNTEPICVYPGKYSGRISDFLRVIGAEHRHIRDFDDFEVLNKPVDFEHVNRVLAHERERVDEFLKSVFNNDVIEGE
jgi:hypothetical protein